MASIEINRNIGTQLVKHTPENVLHVSVTITEIGTFKLRLKSSFWFQTIHDFYTLNSGYLIYLFLVIISNVQSLKTCLDYLLQINCCWIWNYLATLLLPGVNVIKSMLWSGNKHAINLLKKPVLMINKRLFIINKIIT